MREAQDLRASLAGARDMAAKFTRLFPALAGVRLMRHWAGVCTQAEDVAPVLGPVPELEGFHPRLRLGVRVHGRAGRRGAARGADRHRAGCRRCWRRSRVDRLREGRLIHEPSLVVSSGEEG